MTNPYRSERESELIRLDEWQVTFLGRSVCIEGRPHPRLPIHVRTDGNGDGRMVTSAVLDCMGRPMNPIELGTDPHEPGQIAALFDPGMMVHTATGSVYLLGKRGR